MKKQKAKRGRKPGQLKRRALDGTTHPMQILIDAHKGSYKNGVVSLLSHLASLVETRRFVETAETEELALRLKNMPSYGNRALPQMPKPKEQRTKIWRAVWRSGGDTADWLLFLAGNRVNIMLTILLNAVERGDFEFFKQLAVRMASECDVNDFEISKCGLKQAAEPEIAALLVEKQRPAHRRTLSNNPNVADVLRFLRGKGVSVSETKARRLMDFTGYKKKPRGG